VTRRARATLAAVALAGLAALAVWAVGGLHAVGRPVGPNPTRMPLLVAHDRAVDNVVNGVTYDVRGTDTLGEELILFVAALGVSLLLRATRSEHPEGAAAGEADDAYRSARADISGALRVAGAVLIAPVLVLGMYVVTHGQLTPGGGFQGGVMLAGALLLVYAAGQAIALQRLGPISLMEVLDATGALAFALVGLGGIVASGSLLANFLGLARMGSLLSGGTIPLLSLVTGVEVTAALALIFTELLDQALVRRSAG
jgi:multicomponent Na+:H+ antiporter subunit B